MTADTNLVEVLGRAVAPRAVAVYGASGKRPEASQGARIVSRLIATGYAGRVAVVNPTAQEVHGIPTIPSALESPLDIDLALIAVPREAVIVALTDAAAAGARVAIVTSAKFAESDERGVELQAQLLAKARELGVRLIGPNCMGLINFSDGLVCMGRPLPGDPHAGSISVVAQSGLLSLRLAAFIAETGQGIDLWVTLGNCADLNPDEMIEYLGQRAETSVIVVYLEKIEDPERLRRAIASARAAGTDVVLLKSGRSALGSLTAASHTGALAAPDTFVDVLAEEADAIRVDTIREAAQVASVIAAAGKRPIGPFLVTSASGGDCVLAADWCTKFDVPLAQLSEETLRRVHELVPEAAWGNPLDLTPFPFEGGRQMEALAVMAADPDVGALVLMDGFGIPNVTAGDKVVFYEQFGTAADDDNGRKIRLTPLAADDGTLPLPVIIDSRMEQWQRTQLAAAGVAVTSDAETIWRSLGHIARQARAAGTAPNSTQPKPVANDHAPDEDAPARLPELEAFDRLRAAGVPMVATERVDSEEILLATTDRLGYPVVIKGLVPGVVHKADQQLVHIDIWTDEQALAIWQKLSPAVTARGGDIVVQPQLRHALAEIIVATRDDAQFGLHIMVGAGGRWVEADADVAWATAPVTAERATQLILRTKLGRALAGKHPGVIDDSGLPAIIASISRIASDWKATVNEIEINPLMIQADAVTAVDAVITLRT